MHPSGNPWMFHFTHAYSMTEGHIGLEILTSATQAFTEFNAERYKELSTVGTDRPARSSPRSAR